MNLTRFNACFALISGPPGIGKTTFCKALKDFIFKNGDKYTTYLLSSILITYDEIIDKNIELELISQNLGIWKKSRTLIQNMTTHLANYLNLVCSNNELSYDEYIRSLDSFNKDQNLEEKIIKNFIKVIERQLRQCLTSFSQQKQCFVIFILDDIFYYENMRHTFYKEALETNYSSYFSLSFKAEELNFLLSRNISRDPDAKLSESIVRNIFDKFEYPNEVDWEKKFSKCELINKNLDFSDNLFDGLIKIVLRNHESFLILKKQQISLKEIKEKNRLNGEASSQNLVHQCDLILRKLIKAKICNANKNDLKIYSQKLNTRKAQILEMLKNPQSKIHTKCINMIDLSQLETELGKQLECSENDC